MSIQKNRAVHLFQTNENTVELKYESMRLQKYSIFFSCQHSLAAQHDIRLFFISCTVLAV